MKKYIERPQRRELAQNTMMALLSWWALSEYGNCALFIFYAMSEHMEKERNAYESVSEL